MYFKLLTALKTSTLSDDCINSMFDVTNNIHLVRKIPLKHLKITKYINIYKHILLSGIDVVKGK